MRSSETLSGFVCFESPSLCATRSTCVSTAILSFFPKATERMIEAVFLPTPGSEVSSSIVWGTLP